MAPLPNNYGILGCPDSNSLRLFANPDADQDMSDIERHLSDCAGCRDSVMEMRCNQEIVQRHLTEQVPASHPNAALARFHAASDPSGSQTYPDSSSIRIHNRPVVAKMEFKLKMKKYQKEIAACTASLVLLGGLSTLPPVRAATDQFLGIFRTKSTVFVPVDPSRLRELASHRQQLGMLLTGKPVVSGNLEHPQVFVAKADADRASNQIMQMPSDTSLASTHPTFAVIGPISASANFDVQKIKSMTAVLGIDDLTLPTNMTTVPVHVAMDPVEIARYRSGDATLTLIEGRSPSVTVPKSVNLAEVGVAGLRILGMSKEAALQMSSQINWASTLVFPFPDSEAAHQVTVNGIPALLISRHTKRHSSASSWVLYWQHGDRFYVAEGTGMSDQSLVHIASTI